MVDTPTADSPAEPDITHVNPAGQATWFGHPRQLARLFTTEMWERFGYYGMRALLTLYLTQHFMFGDREATGIYGGFTAGSGIPASWRACSPPRCGSASAITACARCSRST